MNAEGFESGIQGREDTLGTLGTLIRNIDG
jgi:hypothetical protein